MYVAIVADPQVDRLLAPADDAIKLALQIEHQLVDKAQLHVAEGRVLDTQQVGLQLIARRIQRILQLAQGARVSDSSISQLEIAARQSLLSSAAMSFFTLCCCSSITRWVMSMLSKISATEYFNGANTLRCQWKSSPPSSAASAARLSSCATIDSCIDRRSVENSRWRI